MTSTLHISRRTRHGATLLCALFTLSMATTAQAQDIKGGLGGGQLALIAGGYMPKGTKAQGKLYRIHAESSLLIIPTARDNVIALDYEATFGEPSGDFFGFPDGRLGLRMPLVQSRWLRVGLGLGVGVGAHMYGWVQPRISVSLPGLLAVEGAYLFVPGLASHRWGQDFFEGERGQAHRRARLMVTLNTPVSSEYDEIGLTTSWALAGFIEHHDLGGPDDPDDRAVPGKYWSFGAGLAF